jgi:N-acetylneuraminic acid mutarotase
VASAELFDPSEGRWTLTQPLPYAIESATATLLPDDTVLVAGGRGADGSTSAAEVYHPASRDDEEFRPAHDDGKPQHSVAQTWTSTAAMHDARALHTATLLDDGTVLVAGGADNRLNLTSAEIYNPRRKTWTTTGSLTYPRVGAAAVVVGWPNEDGHDHARPARSVLVTGDAPNGEVYNTATGTWKPTGAQTELRLFAPATVLSNGQVLVAGGEAITTAIAGTELYDPSTNEWTAGPALPAATVQPAVESLPNGNVLLAGGLGSDRSATTNSLIFTVPGAHKDKD